MQIEWLHDTEFLLVNPACYKTNVDASKTFYKYNFPQILVNKTHFDNATRLLHVKKIDKLLTNGSPWILSTSKCNHDLKSIIAYNKKYKSLIYYITKSSI